MLAAKTMVQKALYWFAIAFLFPVVLLSGCKSQEVIVNKAGRSSAAASGGGIRRLNLRRAALDAGTGTVFFETARVSAAGSLSVVGFGFLSKAASTTSAYEIGFRGAVTDPGPGALVPFARGVAYADKDGTVLWFDPNAMELFPITGQGELAAYDRARDAREPFVLPPGATEPPWKGVGSDNPILCPTWSGEDLYFADYLEGAYVIAQARFDGGRWQVSVFAKPRRKGIAYVCPRIPVGEAP